MREVQRARRLCGCWLRHILLLLLVQSVGNAHGPLLQRTFTGFLPRRTALGGLFGLMHSDVAVADDTAAIGRVVAVPDAHGDPEALIDALALAGIRIPRDPSSALDRLTSVVSLGDLVDRGPDAQGCYKVVKDVKATSILGNHEWFSLLGVDERDDPKTPQREDFFKQYVTKEDLDMFGGWAKRRKAFSPDGELGRQIREDFEVMSLLPNRWARRDELPPLSAAATLFLHGGITYELASKYGSVESMAALGRDSLRQSLAGEDAGLMSELFYEVLQDRHLTSGNPDVCAELEKTLKLLGAARLVVGHTPQVSRRAGVKCKGRLILLDVAMSRWLLNFRSPERATHPVALEFEYSGQAGAETLTSLKLLYPDGTIDVAPFADRSSAVVV